MCVCVYVCACVYVMSPMCYVVNVKMYNCYHFFDFRIFPLLPTPLLLSSPPTSHFSPSSSHNIFFFFLQLPSFSNFDYFSRRNVDVSRLRRFTFLHLLSFIFNDSPNLVCFFTLILILTLTLKLVFCLISILFSTLISILTSTATHCVRYARLRTF
jgi:hypothetical protein